MTRFMTWNFPENRPWYIVRHDPDFGLNVARAPEGFPPVQLSLPVQKHELLGRALETYQEGINLTILLGREETLELFSKIRNLAQDRGWPLPPEDKS